MGVLNVTPDSFYPASRAATTEAAINRGVALFAAGADIVDVGGESTRPGADDVPVDEELARVVDVVAGLVPYGPVSIDTRKAAVAEAAVARGAMIVNDVSGTLATVAGSLGVGYVAMHAQGSPRTMQDNPSYTNVVEEVLSFLSTLGEAAVAAGVPQLWLDPGIGFGKRDDDNWALLAHLDRFVAAAQDLGAAVLVGTSRKRFLGNLATPPLDVDDRLEGSLATAAWAWSQGVSLVRVHDVAAAAEVRDLLTRPVEEVVA
jgi:dihydropteroate synthase